MAQFEQYSRYYNLLYKDKSYQFEVDYLDKVINRYPIRSKHLLDIGCGTGKHGALLTDKGYQVTGIDLSETMLTEAKAAYGDKIEFHQGDVRDFLLDKKFDVITSLFHVMSYQTDPESLEKAFRNVYHHLNDGGYFIFDCWYGPAVLVDQPSVRIKRVSDDEIEVLRVTEPLMHYNENVVDVNFEVHIKDLSSNQTSILKELHSMRYLFKSEVELLSGITGFELIDSFAWLTEQPASEKSWYALFVLKK